MSDNKEAGEGNETSSDAADDLFLSPDDSQAEEIPFTSTEPTDADGDESAETEEPSPAAAPPAVAAVPPTGDPVAVETNSAAFAELEAERDDYRNRMMRLAADLENFRKRTVREKDDMRKYGIDRVVLELLPVLDNLERALGHADKSEDSTTIVDGVRMVQRQFVTALEKHGVKGYDSKGEQFDPQKHEAIQQIETDEHPTGFVLEEYQKGYYLHERLIRPALVVVARNPSGEVAAAPDDAEAAEEQPAAGDGVTPEAPAGDSEPSDGTDESAVN